MLKCNLKNRWFKQGTQILGQYICEAKPNIYILLNKYYHLKKQNKKQNKKPKQKEHTRTRKLGF